MDSCDQTVGRSARDPKRGMILTELLNDNRDFSSPLCVHLSERILEVVNRSTKRRLGKLDPYTMREYLRSQQVPSVSLLTALIFIEKFLSTDSAPHMLQDMTACDLFSVSLMLASKYLHDLDSDHAWLNRDWAVAFRMDLQELNLLEVRFLSALNWCCFVSPAELERACAVAARRLLPVAVGRSRSKRGSRSLTRFRGSVFWRAGSRRARVAAKVLAVLAATYVTYWNGEGEPFGQLPPAPSALLYRGNSTTTTTTTNSTLSIGDWSAQNVTDSANSVPPEWSRFPWTDRDARSLSPPPTAPHLLHTARPAMTTVACGG